MHEKINVNRAIEIARKINIKIPNEPVIKAIKNREIQKALINKWKRKGHTTFCGQYTSNFFQQAGYDMHPYLENKSLLGVNTTGQYANALDNGAREVTPEQAFYLACIGRPVLVLSPRVMIVKGKPYNHAAVTWPIFRDNYDEKKGPCISQQGWYSLCPGYVSSYKAWGKAWTHEMVKYFLPCIA